MFTKADGSFGVNLLLQKWQESPVMGDLDQGLWSCEVSPGEAPLLPPRLLLEEGGWLDPLVPGVLFKHKFFHR